MEEQIWRKIASMHTDGFFITAEMHRTGNGMPQGLEIFIRKQLVMIQQGL